MKDCYKIIGSLIIAISWKIRRQIFARQSIREWAKTNVPKIVENLCATIRRSHAKSIKSFYITEDILQ